MFIKDRDGDPGMAEATGFAAAALEHMTEGACALDGSWHIIACNQACERHLGRPREALLGRPLSEILPAAAGGGPIEAAGRRALAEGQAIGIETEGAVHPGNGRLRVTLFPLGTSEAGAAQESGGGGGLGIVFHDVAGGHGAVAAKEEEGERLRLALDVSGLGDWSWDAATGLVSLSARAAEILGLPPGGPRRVAAAGMLGLLHPEDREGVRAAFGRAADHAIECRVRRPSDGREIRVAVRGRTRPGPDGRPLAVAGVVRDVTARRTAEATLRDSQARLAAMVEQIGAGIAQTDLAGRFTMVNERYCAITGRAREELLGGLRMQDITHPDDLPGNIAAFERLARTGEPFVIEKRYLRPDGSRIWVGNSVAPVRDAEGRVAATVAVSQDVTARREAEAALRESEERLRDLLATLDLGASMARDPDGTILFWSEGCARLYGWTAAEAVGRHAHELLRTAFPVPQAEIGAALERDGQWTGDLRQRTRDGRELVVGARKALRRGPDGRPVAVLEALTDVTAQRRAEAALAESEARFRTLADTMPGIAWTAAPDGTVTHATEQWYRYTGIAPERNARDWPDLALHPDDRERCREAWHRALREGSFYEIEVRNRRHDGAYRWFLTRATPMRDARGDVTAWFGTSTDIHDRKLGEEALDRYRALMQRARDIVFMLRPEDGVIVEANDAASAAYGYTHEELVGLPVRMLRAPETRDEIPAQIGRAATEGILFETVHQRRDGSRFPAEVSAIGSDVGGRRLIVSVVRDITERRRAEAALRESEARFRHMADHAPVMVWVTDPDGRCTYLGRSWHEFTGQAVEDGLGLGWFDCVHPEDRPRTREVFAQANARYEPFRVEYRLRRRDGAWRWAIDAAAPRFGEAGEFLGFVGSVIDITERRETEEAQRRLAEVLEERVAERTAERDRIWRLSRDLLAVAGFDGFLKSVNPAWTGLLGHGEAALLARPFAELVHPEDRDGVAAAVASMREGRTLLRFESRLRRADGGLAWVAWTAVPEDEVFYAVGRDVTAEKEAAETLRRNEEQLRQASRMEAVGQLTGGVAHDFNNLLQVVSANLELLRPVVEAAGERERRRHAAALEGVRRGASLTRQLLAFARRQPLEPQVVAPARLLAETADMLRHTLGEQVAVETAVAEGLWNIFVDPGQLQNALVNLALNARDAMPEGGRLTLRAANADLADPRAAVEAGAGLDPGQYVALAVADTGSGMDAATRARAFEPFFTTKPEGQGTGLGLSMVYGFARQSGGQARILSAPGQGTTVVLHLPRDRRETEAAADTASAAGVGDAGEVEAGEGETILVVEDNPGVQAAVVETLTDLGYHPLRASEAEAALAVLASGLRVDLLFTDVVMPGPVSSVELARRAREIQPGIAVLFTSGYAEGVMLQHGRPEPGQQLLPKPYGRETLARKLRAALGPHGSRRGERRPPPARAPRPLRVLVVEDEALIRMSAAAMLEAMGHVPIEAADGPEALAHLQGGGAVDVLMADLGLPGGMDGHEMIARARALRPGLSVLIATGHDAVADAAAFPGALPLPKPYDEATLRDALTRLAPSEA